MKSFINLWSWILFILIIANACSQKDDVNKMSKEEIEAINNVPIASDVDDSNRISSELRVYSFETIDGVKKNILFYSEPQRDKIILSIYEIINIDDRDRLTKAIKDIRLKAQVKMKIVLKFYLKENLVETVDGKIRKKEDLIEIREIGI